MPDLTEAQLGAIADRVASILLARQYPERGIAAEIETWLAEHQPATVPEIAFGITARESAVRYVLATGDRFQAAPPPPGRSPKAKCWQLVVPADRTQPKPRRSGTSQ